MALRPLVLFALLFPLSLLSTPLEFKACQLKYQVSSIEIDKIQAFAVNNEYALFYSKEEPDQKVAKRDPFLGLNLVRAPKQFKHSFKFHNNSTKKLAGILPASVTEGKILSEQIGLNRLAKFSKPLKRSTLVSDSTCGIVGISTGDGVIGREYIRHFLSSEKLIYGDAGIRLTDENGVCVSARNPFLKNNPFESGDIIVQMDGKKTESAAQVSRDILLSQPQSSHDFIVLRDAKELKLKTEFQTRLGGGLLPETFLETTGFWLDENLVLKKDNADYALKKGDKLMYVMSDRVTTPADVRRVLSQKDPNQNMRTVLLFQRDGFDFFIHLLKP